MEELAEYPVHKKTGQTLQEAIIDLYLNVKIRNNEDIANWDESMFAEEKTRLSHNDPFTIIEYIRSSIEILMNMKIEENELEHQKNITKDQDSELDLSMQEPPKDYERMLQSLEAEIRNHIRVEQQLKLHIESSQSKFDETEKQRDQFEDENKTLETDMISMKEGLRTKDKTIEKLKSEMQQKSNENKDLTDKFKEIEIKLKKLEKYFEIEQLKKTKTYEANEAVVESAELEKPHEIQKWIGGEEINQRPASSQSQEKRPQAPKPTTSSVIPQPGSFQTMLTKSITDVQRNNKTSIQDQPRDILKLKNDYNRIYKELKKQKDLVTRDENLLELLARSPDKTKDNNPYIIEFYKKRLEDKNGELYKLKQRLGKLKNEMSVRRSTSRERGGTGVVRAATATTGGTGASHKRSRSQLNKPEGREIVEKENCQVSSAHQQGRHPSVPPHGVGHSQHHYAEKRDRGHSPHLKKREDNSRKKESTTYSETTNHLSSCRSGSTENILRDKSGKRSRPVSALKGAKNSGYKHVTTSKLIQKIAATISHARPSTSSRKTHNNQ